MNTAAKVSDFLFYAARLTRPGSIQLWRGFRLSTWNATVLFAYFHRTLHFLFLSSHFFRLRGLGESDKAILDDYQ